MRRAHLNDIFPAWYLAMCTHSQADPEVWFDEAAETDPKVRLPPLPNVGMVWHSTHCECRICNLALGPLKGRK